MFMFMFIGWEQRQPTNRDLHYYYRIFSTNGIDDDDDDNGNGNNNIHIW